MENSRVPDFGNPRLLVINGLILYFYKIFTSEVGTRSRIDRIKVVGTGRSRSGAGPMKSNLGRGNIAALVSEMNSIHSANSLYWELGEAVTLEARAEHQRRRDRLEELRSALEKLQKSAGQKGRKQLRPPALELAKSLIKTIQRNPGTNS